jgi:hypothetical protein
MILSDVEQGGLPESIQHSLATEYIATIVTHCRLLIFSHATQLETTQPSIRRLIYHQFSLLRSLPLYATVGAIELRPGTVLTMAGLIKSVTDVPRDQRVLFIQELQNLNPEYAQLLGMYEEHEQQVQTHLNKQEQQRKIAWAVGCLAIAGCVCTPAAIAAIYKIAKYLGY